MSTRNNAEAELVSTEKGKISKHAHKKFRATRFGRKLLGVVMAAAMTVGVAAPTAAPAVAGPITRNVVAATVYPIHASQHVVSALEGGRFLRHALEVLPVFPLALIPGPVTQWVSFPEGGWELATIGKILTLPAVVPVVHAAVWNGVDLALLGTGAVVGTTATLGAGALGTAAVVGTPIVLGTGAALATAAAAPIALGAAGLGAAALGTTAVVGTGLALGAAALGTTAVVGTGLALGAAALATTAVVGTTAAVGTGIVAHNLLNSSTDEQNPNEETNQSTPEDGTQTIDTADVNAQLSDSTQA